MKRALCLLAAVLSLSVSAQQADTEKQFFEAIRKGDAATVSSLVDAKPALMQASYRNGITPVLLAVYAQHRDIAELLLSKSGTAPTIFEAAALGRIDTVRAMLKKDPELIHAWSADGWTALHLNFNNIEMAKLLLDRGADVNLNSKNKLNATPLQGAAANNWIDLAKLYLAHGANVNCRSEEGGSPLHEAAGNGFVDFARMLIEHGADVNQKDDNGKTPLTVALESKQPESAKLLREHGATE